MRKWLDRYYGRLRKVKANYMLLNIFNLKKLAHARRMYRKYGVKRSVLLPINSSTSLVPPWSSPGSTVLMLKRSSPLQ